MAKRKNGSIRLFLAVITLVGITNVPAYGQTSYWTGTYHVSSDQKNCAASEVLLVLYISIVCLPTQKLSDDIEYQNVSKAQHDSESRIALLESNIASLANANDALSKRLDDMEVKNQKP